MLKHYFFKLACILIRTYSKTKMQQTPIDAIVEQHAEPLVGGKSRKRRACKTRGAKKTRVAFTTKSGMKVSFLAKCSKRKSRKSRK
jgi:hypothetical protein